MNDALGLTDLDPLAALALGAFLMVLLVFFVVVFLALGLGAEEEMVNFSTGLVWRFSLPSAPPRRRRTRCRVLSFWML